ncbi:hypothetical protein ABZS79_07475 [Streptomyces griseoloalbus]|uniref:hypothetical protein n=1 Tax=Streptomyces griseoloalbus TaxID=67303 RepID=UPI0033B2CC57
MTRNIADAVAGAPVQPDGLGDDTYVLFLGNEVLSAGRQRGLSAGLSGALRSGGGLAGEPALTPGALFSALRAHEPV